MGRWIAASTVRQLYTTSTSSSSCMDAALQLADGSRDVL